MRKFVIIVAGGSGTRFGSQLPKQFLLLGNRPVLMHTIDAFTHAIDGIEVIVVLPESQQDYWHELCDTHGFTTPHKVVTGGDSRYASVKNGLAAIDAPEGVVAVHDGVRPLITTNVITTAFETAQACGSAIPVVDVTDSVRQVLESGNSIALERASLRAVQTPQTFALSLLRNAYKGEYSPLFTDDASVVEAMGVEVRLIDGDPTNIKITRPLDLILATHIIAQR